ncbi:hypothetical protein [Actinomadura yumaensis]|uniref:TPM domain-containing protein n=1 Tax=Actinomadura yumaensis TaxID=111807 RepID=A0ABW2CVB5_9ACTN
MTSTRVRTLFLGALLGCLAPFPAAGAAAGAAAGERTPRAVASGGENDPIPAYAYKRLDRIGAALAKDPLFVDPDLASALGPADRARVRRAAGAASRRIGAHVYVVVAPNPRQSEAEGDDEAFLTMLHRRTGRDGLYLMANSRGRLQAGAFRVPREIRFSDLWDDARPDEDRPFAGLAARLADRLRHFGDRPSASPTMPYRIASPDPFGKENELRPAEAHPKGPFLTGLLLAGPVAAIALYWLGRGGAALRRRTGPHRPTVLDADAMPVEAHPGAPDRPSTRWLRRTGGRDLERLRLLLPAAGDGRGTRYALSAYDAAKIVYDEAGGGAEGALDLAGAIVLARQGRAALARRTENPPPPCFVNPLHGESTHRRPVELDGRTRRRPLCAACNGAKPDALPGRVLKVPGPDGPRPHFLVPGIWRDTAFGADGNTLVPRVLEHLGVH